MSFTTWVVAAGVLFLTMALTSALLQRAPLSSAMLYLLVGAVLGPLGFGALVVDPVAHAAWLSRVAEIAVVLSLFVGGMKLRLPPSDPAWRAAWRLAGPVMIATIAGVAFVGWWALGLDAGAAILLGAVLAPTDPVLAAEAKVASARDRDRLRYALSGEAGLNDGAAFPFVVLGLLWMQHEGRVADFAARWALHRVLWAVPAALVIGFVVGYAAGEAATRLHARFPRAPGLNDFLTLALVALSYGFAEAVGAWGFLAAFAAGVGLRRAEVHVVRARPPPTDLRGLEARVAPSEPGSETPAEAVVERDLTDAARAHPAVAAGEMMVEATSFGEALERIAEVVVVVLIGVVASTRLDARGLVVAAALFFVVRPAATWVGLLGTPTTRAQRVLIAWLGIRGAGTLFYLAYAAHERPSSVTAIGDVALTVVVASIVLHGVTATPLLRRYARLVER